KSRSVIVGRRQASGSTPPKPGAAQPALAAVDRHSSGETSWGGRVTDTPRRRESTACTEREPRRLLNGLAPIPKYGANDSDRGQRWQGRVGWPSPQEILSKGKRRSLRPACSLAPVR